MGSKNSRSKIPEHIQQRKDNTLESRKRINDEIITLLDSSPYAPNSLVLDEVAKWINDSLVERAIAHGHDSCNITVSFSKTGDYLRTTFYFGTVDGISFISLPEWDKLYNIYIKTHKLATRLDSCEHHKLITERVVQDMRRIYKRFMTTYDYPKIKPSKLIRFLRGTTELCTDDYGILFETNIHDTGEYTSNCTCNIVIKW